MELFIRNLRLDFLKTLWAEKPNQRLVITLHLQVHMFGSVPLFMRSLKYPEVFPPCKKWPSVLLWKDCWELYKQGSRPVFPELYWFYKVNLSSLKLSGHVWMFEFLHVSLNHDIPVKALVIQPVFQIVFHHKFLLNLWKQIYCHQSIRMQLESFWILEGSVGR